MFQHGRFCFTYLNRVPLSLALVIATLGVASSSFAQTNNARSLPPIISLILDRDTCLARRELFEVPSSTALPLFVPDSDPAGTQLAFPVADFPGAVNGVSLNLEMAKNAANASLGEGHTWAGDLTVKLSSPDSTELTIFDRTGRNASGVGDSSNVQGPYTFSDSAMGDWWAAAAAIAGEISIPSGRYRTSLVDTGALTSLNLAFSGKDGDGSWTVSFLDNSGGDTGDVVAASIELSTFPAVFWAEFAGFASVGDASLGCSNQDAKPEVNLARSENSGGNIAIDHKRGLLFYDRDGKIASLDLESGQEVELTTVDGPGGIAVDPRNQKIYWTEFSQGFLRRADYDGTNAETLATGINSPSGITLDLLNNEVYVITYNVTSIFRFELDGSNQQAVLTGIGGQGVGIAVNPHTGNLYYSRRGSEVRVVDTDGNNDAVLIANQGEVEGLAIDGDKVYFTNGIEAEIRRANLADGSNVEFVANMPPNVWHIAVAGYPVDISIDK